MDVRISVQNNARVQHVIRIKHFLQFPHDIVRFGAPFHFNERRDITPGTVLGFQRPFVFDRNNLAHFLHHHPVRLDFLLRTETLGKDQVQVTFQRVAHARGVVVTVLFKHSHQILRHWRQRIDFARDVFNQHRSTGFATAANHRNQTFSHVPIGTVHGWILREWIRFLSWVQKVQVRAVQRGRHRFNVLVQLRVGWASALDQKRRAVLPSFRDRRHQRHDLLVLFALT
mmetsp:Transcript_8325/g.26615  ORF Transcript_8325/g.26615 Transcript_8325/m.26615 type:complete len:228 (-) Transcript_8325:1543-2226(-)